MRVKVGDIVKISSEFSDSRWYHGEYMIVEHVHTSFTETNIIKVNYTFNNGGNLILEKVLKIVSDRKNRIGKLFME